MFWIFVIVLLSKSLRCYLRMGTWNIQSHSGETVLQFHAAPGPVLPVSFPPSGHNRTGCLFPNFGVSPTTSAVGWKTNGRLSLAWLLVAAIKRFPCSFSCFRFALLLHPSNPGKTTHHHSTHWQPTVPLCWCTLGTHIHTFFALVSI